jgi:hypothetical protein
VNGTLTGMHDTEHLATLTAPAPPLSLEQVAAMKAPEVCDALNRATAGAFQHLTISRQQARVHVFAMTIEDIGGCTRQSAYRIAATQPTDPGRAVSGQDRINNLDHLTATSVLPALGHVLGAEHHRGVTLNAAGLALPGVIPLYWPTAAVLATIRTTPSTEPVARWNDNSPLPAPDRIATFALAVAALQQRMPVAWIGYLRISRGTGDSTTDIEALTEWHEGLVAGRMSALALHAEHPDKAPADYRDAHQTGAALPTGCARCPWLTRCWPDHPATRTS